MKFNIIVKKEYNNVVGVTTGDEMSEKFIQEFYNPKIFNEEGEEETIENTTTDYYPQIEVDFDLLQEFADGKDFKYIDNEIIEVEDNVI